MPGDGLARGRRLPAFGDAAPRDYRRLIRTLWFGQVSRVVRSGAFERLVVSGPGLGTVAVHDVQNAVVRGVEPQRPIGSPVAGVGGGGGQVSVDVKPIRQCRLVQQLVGVTDIRARAVRFVLDPNGVPIVISCSPGQQ